MIGLFIELIEWTIKLMVITAVIMFVTFWFLVVGTIWLVAAAVAAKNHRPVPPFPGYAPSSASPPALNARR